MIYEALVKVKDNVNSSLSPEEQQRLLWKEGDIVAIRPKGWIWGRKEVKEFLIVSLDLSEDEATSLCCTYCVVGVDNEGIEREECVCRSRYHIELDSLFGISKMRLQDPNDEYQPLKDSLLLPNKIKDKQSNPKFDAIVEKCKLNLSQKCNEVYIRR